MVLVPLGALAFKAVGPEPDARRGGGLRVGSAGYDASPLVTPTDAMLAGLTTAAAQTVDPATWSTRCPTTSSPRVLGGARRSDHGRHGEGLARRVADIGEPEPVDQDTDGAGAGRPALRRPWPWASTSGAGCATRGLALLAYFVVVLSGR